jgi:hypothetical protein
LNVEPQKETFVDMDIFIADDINIPKSQHCELAFDRDCFCLMMEGFDKLGNY